MKASNYIKPLYLITETDLTFDIRDTSVEVEGCFKVVRDVNTVPGEPLVLDLGEEVELIRLEYSVGNKYRDVFSAPEYRRDREKLIIYLPSDIEVFYLFVETKIDPWHNTTLEGLYASKGMLLTQCEAEGFRHIVPYLDHPDVLSVFTVKIIADSQKYPVLLSNPNFVEESVRDGIKTIVWHDPFPKPCYLFALVAGDLDYLRGTFATMSGRIIELRVYSTRENVESGQCAHALESLKNSMRFDERRFGRECDVDLFMIVVTSAFNFGAMENKGLNIFNSKYVLALPTTASDTDFERIEGVVGHEYFHNWSGNRVTCRNWLQLSLKEGLTVFRDQEFSLERWGLRKKIHIVRTMRDLQFEEDSGPLAHPIRPEEIAEVNNMYTTTVYEKGAEVIRMIATILGVETFRKALDEYFARFDGQAVTCEDFVSVMEEVSGVDLRQFRNWYSFAGTPIVKIKSNYHKEAQMLTLSVSQSCDASPGQPVKPNFHIPFGIAFIGRDGKEVTPLIAPPEYDTETKILQITDTERLFSFQFIEDDEPVLSLNRLAAPVKVEYDYSLADLCFLMKYDTDSFSRWDAAQEVGRRILVDMIVGKTMTLPEIYLSTFGDILDEAEIDLNLLAELMLLPSESYVALVCKPVDPILIRKTRNMARKILADRFHLKFFRLYHAYHEEGEARFDPHSVAKRAVVNHALRYLTDDAALVQNHFDTATNMSDRETALTFLVEKGDDTASKAFYELFAGYDEVVNKWLRIQAQHSDVAGVKALMKHPKFSLETPNRVRAVMYGFINHVEKFHALSGEGYAFLADFIIKYDAINSTVAASLAEELTVFMKYGLERQLLMRAEVERLVREPKLSTGTREILEKSLR